MSYFARLQTLSIDGDIYVFKKYLDELEKLDFVPLPAISSLENDILLLRKHGVLRLERIAEFAKILHYFMYLKKLNTTTFTCINAWLQKIELPQEICKIADSLQCNPPMFKDGVYERLDSINKAIRSQKNEINKQCERILQKNSISGYLVDRQVHFVDSKECLLLRAGFDRVLDGRIIDRTQGGYFYVFPQSLSQIHSKLGKLYDEREIIIYTLEREISNVFCKNLAFLIFINKEFDRFDALQARICFAKEHDYDFVFPTMKDSKKSIVLSDFCHPALHNPIPCNIVFDKQILLISGVNAGGKTMLLKSILSAALLAKYLIPFKINPHKSRIAYFKKIYAIINDPQSAKNDISTFAGRMIEFKNFMDKNDFLLGIDEIELGTDANEASALYVALLEHLQKHHAKIILTTHHKQLASLLASNPHVELIAALYDESARVPKYHFLQGCIGKSYAFETALRYGIPLSIIHRAKEIYGVSGENLNELIEKTSLLQTSLLQKERELESLLSSAKNKNDELNRALLTQNDELKKKKAQLDSIYNKALEELKQVLKTNDSKEIHRFLNKQHRDFKKLPELNHDVRADFRVGSRVQYKRKSGTIISMKGKNAIVEMDNSMQVTLNVNNLAPALKPLPAKQTIHIDKGSACSVSLDLHGKRADEAREMLDKFISDSLVAGFDEVLVYHGIGSGVLSRVVREFLSSHPKIKDFSDAPNAQGGFGAKIIKL